MSGFLARHGIVRNKIKADMLQFGLPFALVFGVGIAFSNREGALDGFWRTVWDVVRNPGSLLSLPGQRMAGLALIVGGLTVMVVAQIVLWRNYAATLVIRENHQLIQRGLYRWVRHPIYLGVLIVIFGIPVYGSSLAGFLVMLALIPILLNRIRLEEGLLMEEFGDSYRSYQETTKKLIPFIH
jgi:steroid 5-alpha reductase family enzyme